MEIIGKISKGSRMDQIYLPKKRSGFITGSYVLLKPLESKKVHSKLYFYKVNSLEPIKIKMINQICSIVNNTVSAYDNCIIVGSFLERGFHFNDVDVMVISESEVNSKLIKKKIERTMGVTAQIISLNNKTLRKGLATDPLYRMMLSKCVALKRFIYKIKPNINYKLLDLHLLKSKTLIDNFDILGGGEKYYLIRNMVAIAIFLKSKKVDKEIVDKEIKIIFKLKSVNEIKQNRLDKTTFVKKYKQFYKKTFDKIMEGIKCGA